MILGVGGISFLEQFKLLDTILKFHINEGHASLLTLALYKKFQDVNHV
jgi:glucan phosphorylase